MKPYIEGCPAAGHKFTPLEQALINAGYAYYEYRGFFSGEPIKHAWFPNKRQPFGWSEVEIHGWSMER